MGEEKVGSAKALQNKEAGTIEEGGVVMSEDVVDPIELQLLEIWRQTKRTADALERIADHTETFEKFLKLWERRTF